MDEIDKGEALREMLGIAELGNVAMAHLLADALLCRVLREAGHDELVDAYASIEKWYA